MALLATSCTMRNKPSRLLDKGPDYLRTRTNDQIFANRRKSAVELLAASRPQYVKSAAVLDSAAAGLTAGTPDRHCRSICQPREKPPTRSKSEFDISKLQELLAQDELDGDGTLRDTIQGGLSAESQPLSAAGERREEEEEARTTPATQVTSAPPIPPPRDPESRPRKINTQPDRQDESQRFFHSPSADVAAAASTSPPPPPPPSSSQSGAGTQSCAPALYTARPIYINLGRSHSHAAPASAVPPQIPPKPKPPPVPERSIRVLSAAHHQLRTPPAAMSEESSDKTPTNPTGGDMTPGEASSSTALLEDASQSEEDEEEVVEVGVISSSVSGDAAAAAAVATSSTSSSPGPRVSLRSSGEFVSISGTSSFNPVPRSFSDIACHHSRAGSDVSSETSRASRASAGANLEKFFNEMGMERDILDPMMQLQQRYGGSELDIYESVSSLESHDARSICSALSRSEKEISDPESFERNQQQTSVVERNARIIKWLCSVKKAKTPATSVQGSAAS